MEKSCDFYVGVFVCLQAFWPSMVMKKWLNIQPKNNDFSEDEVDTETESEDDVCSVKEERTRFDTSYARRTPKNMSSCTDHNTDGIPAKGLIKHKRGQSETMRVHYIKTKDVRMTIGTWNVAGRIPDEDLEIDEWLCMDQPADIYILGFQEVVPLSAVNVLGAETRRPILKWESIIRKALNKTSERVAIHKSYSAPTSPILNSNGSLGPTKISVPETKVINMLNWPEKALDVTPKVLSSGAKLRRVLSLSNSARVSSDWLAPQDVGGGLKRVHHSSGDLGLLWAEHQERTDTVDSLDDVAEQVLEEEDDFFEDPIEMEDEKSAFLDGQEKSTHRYVRIVSKQMVGIYISVWVRKRLRRHINNLKVSPVGVGLMGYMGNKGSVSVSMSLYQTRLCFVCSHLTSGHKVGDEEKRNSNVSEILKRTRFSSVLDPDQPQTIPCHDQIFWFGDLNYRNNKQDEEVRKLVSMKQWDQLLYSDQLCKELKRGRVFEGWKEGVINFPPTYKYEFNSDRYAGENPKEGEKRRAPAWCDRILWMGKGIKQLCYNRAEIRMSDHRPVSSVFALEVEVFDPRKLRRALNLTSAAVHPVIILDEAELELLP
ncbi:type I inositol polyphosphate 5-phosphatase 2-like isoform X1 [Bidens hawaiensis]|uniref:type I inositol polyphosphate 5-phosphatase 2-like isoform X1 n=1 Tax=Bidens hawaiensis TaxID=980011 RepID=UPI0040499BE1